MIDPDRIAEFRALMERLKSGEIERLKAQNEANWPAVAAKLQDDLKIAEAKGDTEMARATAMPLAQVEQLRSLGD